MCSGCASSNIAPEWEKKHKTGRTFPQKLPNPRPNGRKRSKLSQVRRTLVESQRNRPTSPENCRDRTRFDQHRPNQPMSCQNPIGAGENSPASTKMLIPNDDLCQRRHKARDCKSAHGNLPAASAAKSEPSPITPWVTSRIPRQFATSKAAVGPSSASPTTIRLAGRCWPRQRSSHFGTASGGGPAPGIQQRCRCEQAADRCHTTRMETP